MATALSIINRALRLAGVIDSDRASGGTEFENAFETLNAMLAEWFHADIGLPDFSFASANDPLSTDAGDSEAISYALAERIAPEYGLALPPQAVQTGAEAMARMRLRYFQSAPADYSELPHRRYRYSIING